MTTATRRRRTPPPPPPLPVGEPAPLPGSASPSLTGALEQPAAVVDQPVPVAEPPVPIVEPAPAATPVAEPNPPVQAPQPQPETSEIATVRTRYPHPLFIASQHKVVGPNEEVPVIVDAWVRHHLNHPNGALVRV